MLRKLTCLLSLTGGCLLLLSAQAPAQKEKKIEKTNDEIKLERMQKLMAAYDLAQQGRDQKAPEYLITAADILRKLSPIKDLQEMKKLDVNPVIAGAAKEDLVDKEVKAPSLLEQADELLKEASDLGASQNVNVDRLIESVKERDIDKEERAVVGGPKQISRQIGGGQLHTYKFNLYTGKPSAWSFHANSPLNVAVVRSDNDAPWFWATTMSASHTWHPSWHPNPKLKQAPITIRIRNLSKQPKQYQMALQ